MSTDPFKSISIGSLRLKNNLIAAPMAGISSLPYRMLAMEQGCALAISEMVASEGAIRAKEKSEKYYRNDPSVRPFGIQVWGAKPAIVYDAIKMLENLPVDLFDINMGCPAKKICKKGAGSALMKTPDLALEVIRSARKATDKPLTVKIRAGWEQTQINCVEIAKLAESEGADAITIHPRTRMEWFKGKSNWELIGQVKAAVKIPVIGNGDVKNREDALKMLETTSCDAVMIGRAAVGNPWIFREILEENYEHPNRKEMGKTALRHLEMLNEFYDDNRAILNMRKMLPWYGKGISGVKHFLRDIYKIDDHDVLVNRIKEFFSE